MAIPEAQNVVFQHMGIEWFIGAILIMLLCTLVTAYYVKSALNKAKDRSERFWAWIKERPGKLAGE